MPRIYKRFKPHGSTYVRKTAYKHGREVVKPIDVDDFEEMVRICLIHRDEYKPSSKQYFKCIEITSYSSLVLIQDVESTQY